MKVKRGGDGGGAEVAVKVKRGGDGDGGGVKVVGGELRRGVLRGLLNVSEGLLNENGPKSIQSPYVFHMYSVHTNSIQSTHKVLTQERPS